MNCDLSFAKMLVQNYMTKERWRITYGDGKNYYQFQASGGCNIMSHNRYKMESKLDWIVFFLISLFCFFTFQQGDILHTGGSSFAYLNGHILDFYDYNAQFMEVNNYLPSTYFVCNMESPYQTVGNSYRASENSRDGCSVLVQTTTDIVLFCLRTSIS